jgi:hypothetical protein
MRLSNSVNLLDYNDFWEILDNQILIVCNNLIIDCNFWIKQLLEHCLFHPKTRSW